ncbi:MAG: N-methyl-L-tryptophan oxidase [Alphaproteobacteria bacterium]|nr:N-methyl-L-tryptophan oxidase [Alphaproteobacteria bacterium]
MARTYDVIVVGVGAMGSAACWRLAQRGLRVLGLERFTIPNRMGSSHGVNRIIRLAYFEDPAYVPLLLRAYELWRDTEREAGKQLLHITRALDVGRADGRLVSGALESCRTHNLDHEVLDAAETMRRFPAHNIPSDFVALVEPQGGFVACEAAVTSQAKLARRAGADIHECEAMIEWTATANGVRVRTEHETYEAGNLILSSGAWVGEHVSELRGKAVPERQALGWFETKRPELFTPAAFPVSILETEDGGHPYQFPEWGVPGFKIGLYHHMNEHGAADTLARETSAKDEALLRGIVERYFPAASGKILDLQTCLFTNTRDEHFVVDVLPATPQVVVASPCSGHGFKFASVMGEVLADLATGKRPRFDLSLFALSRRGL